MSEFETFIVPISGIDFVKYIAFYSVLSGIKPKTIYCASGGCMMSYIAMMSSFTENVEKWKISSELFVQKPIEFIPRLLCLSAFGHMYRRPNTLEYIKSLFVEKKLKDVEIISGHFTTKTNDIVISTNFSKTESCVTESDNFKVEYNDGNMDEIIKSIEYTTNIPLILEPIGVHQNIDYGVVSPSPVIFFLQKLKKSIYFSPVDIEDFKASTMASILFDRNIMTEFWAIISPFDGLKQDFESLDSVKAFLPSCSSYCLVIYTKTKISFTISNFTSEQVYNRVQKIKKDIYFRLYYKPV